MFGKPEHDPNDPRGVPPTVGNGRQSYIMAGYRVKGASADASASRLSRLRVVQQRIAELQREEQRRQSVRLRHWRTLLPKAQQVLEDAMEGKDITTPQIRAAQEVIRQAEGAARYRFAIQKAGDMDTGLEVTLWGGGKRDREGGGPDKVS